MKKPQKKALVTGGSGFIGSHLCEELLRRGFLLMQWIIFPQVQPLMLSIY